MKLVYLLTFLLLIGSNFHEASPVVKNEASSEQLDFSAFRDSNSNFLKYFFKLLSSQF